MVLLGGEVVGGGGRGVEGCQREGVVVISHLSFEHWVGGSMMLIGKGR